MTKVIVTGASGFIGKPLVQKLESIGVSVVSLSRKEGDITNKTIWNNLSPADTVIHLAARSYIPDSWEDPDSFIDTNINGTRLALEYCKKHKSKLIFISAYLYGQPEKLPINESDRISPNNPYALSKYLAEKLCAFYSEHWGIPIAVIRPFNVYGPDQRKEFLIPEILEQIKNNNFIRVKDLEPRRDYVYIDDLIQAIVNTLDIPDGFHIINIGTGTSYSVRQIIETIQTIAGTNLSLESGGGTRKHEISDVRADITAAYELLNWKPKFNLADGIKKIFKLERLL